jgi:hypothetical protein
VRYQLACVLRRWSKQLITKVPVDLQLFLIMTKLCFEENSGKQLYMFGAMKVHVIQSSTCIER